MTDKPTEDGVVKPSPEGEKVVDFQVYRAKLTPLDELVKRAANDAGAPFETESLKLLTEAKKTNLAGFERALWQLKKVGVRISHLERLIAPKPAGETKSHAKSGHKVDLAETEPWPEPVDGATLLSDLVKQVRRYVVLSDHDASAIALWIVHAHALDAAQHSPRLNLRSATKRCGKTTLLKTIEPLVPKGLRTENVTTSAIFRIVETSRPTLLIDEADNFADLNDELRKLMNAGFEAGGGVLRTVEVNGDHEVRQFAVYCPTVLSGIGKMPATIEDRSIVINLQRRTRDEKIERLRRDRVHHLSDLGRKSARWACDNRRKLAEADPVLPDALGDREHDKWRPLISIADLTGGIWPGKARLAALMSSGEDVEDEIMVMLLADIRDVFGDAEAMHSKVILDKLKAIDERPWRTWGKGKEPGLNEYHLRSLLKPLGVHPGNIRLGTEQRKGYYRRDLADAFKRYIPVHHLETGSSSVHPSQSFANSDLDQNLCVPDDQRNTASVPVQPVKAVEEIEGGTDGTDKNAAADTWTSKTRAVRDIGEFE